MIVFGYAKDIAPINSIQLHIDHFRLRPKAGLEQHWAPHETNQPHKDKTPLWPTSKSFLYKRLLALLPVVAF